MEKMVSVEDNENGDLKKIRWNPAFVFKAGLVVLVAAFSVGYIFDYTSQYSSKSKAAENTVACTPGQYVPATCSFCTPAGKPTTAGSDWGAVGKNTSQYQWCSCAKQYGKDYSESTYPQCKQYMATCTPGKWVPNTCSFCTAEGYPSEEGKDWGEVGVTSSQYQWCDCANRFDNANYNETKYPQCPNPSSSCTPGTWDSTKCATCNSAGKWDKIGENWGSVGKNASQYQWCFCAQRFSKDIMQKDFTTSNYPQCGAYTQKCQPGAWDANNCTRCGGLGIWNEVGSDWGNKNDNVTTEQYCSCANKNWKSANQPEYNQTNYPKCFAPANSTIVPTGISQPTQTPSPTNTVDKTPPTLYITRPGNNVYLWPNTTYVLQASAADNAGGVKVEFYVDNKITCSVDNPPYRCSWYIPTQSKINYVISVKATDTSSNTTVSSVTVHVR